ncbi:MAG: DMT family transporter [Thalassobaculales bacterium]
MDDTTRKRLAHGLLLIAPAMFSSNMVTAKLAADLVPPVALAVLRWGLAFLILLPFAGPGLWRQRAAVRAEWAELLLLGGLGMGICGALLYYAADTTSATNIGLIYAASPVMITAFGALLYGEAMSRRQAIGTAVALAGVVTIVLRGDIGVLLALDISLGDALLVLIVSAWAAYALRLRYRPSRLAPQTRFAAIVLFGVISMLPFLALETALGDLPALDAGTFALGLFLALVPGLGAYQAYGWLQTVLGAGRTSLLLYLSPVYNAAIAYALLGETLRPFHLAGIGLVLLGIYLGTVPAKSR